MGYYSQYSLTQLQNAIPAEVLAALIAADECASAALDADGDTRRPQKWYEHEECLCAWSDRHPDTLFVLHAEGEDSDGIWDKYFLRGQLVHTELFTGLGMFDSATLSKIIG